MLALSRVRALHSPEHGAARVAASWINPLHIAATGRLYVFYTFNAGNTTRWPSGRPVSNSNLLGGQFYRHSDDAGMTWSARVAVTADPEHTVWRR